MGNIINEKNFNCSTISTNNDMVNCDYQIGFTSDYYHIYIFIVLSSIGILLGIILFFDYLTHKIKKNKNRSYGSMKMLFRILSILDFLSSVYWLLSTILLSKVENIKNNDLCKPFSFIYTFLFIYNFYFINCILKHFRKLNFDPIDSIYKPKKSLINYLLTGFILSLLISLIALFFGILGRSPMNTCFINTELNQISIIIYGVGIILIIYIIYQIIHGLYFSKMFVNDDFMKSLYVQNSIYALVFCGLHIPMLIYL